MTKQTVSTLEQWRARFTRSVFFFIAIVSFVFFFPVIQRAFPEVYTQRGFILHDGLMIYAPPATLNATVSVLGATLYPDPFVGAQVLPIRETSLYAYAKGLFRLSLTSTFFQKTSFGQYLTENDNGMRLPLDSIIRFTLLFTSLTSMIIFMFSWRIDEAAQTATKRAAVYSTFFDILTINKVIGGALLATVLLRIVGVTNFVALYLFAIVMAIIQIFIHAGMIVTAQQHSNKHIRIINLFVVIPLITVITYYANRMHNFNYAAELPAVGWDAWLLSVHSTVYYAFYWYMTAQYGPSFILSCIKIVNPDYLRRVASTSLYWWFVVDSIFSFCATFVIYGIVYSDAENTVAALP